MSVEFDEYLEKRNKYFRKACNWIKRSVPELLKGISEDEFTFMRDFHHDVDTIPCIYEPYDKYLFGKPKAIDKINYKKAKLQRIHMNPYNWQHWVLMDEEGGTTCLEMPHIYLLELICEWWSYSWEEDNLWSIFDYYAMNVNKIKLNKKTRAELEEMLYTLEFKLNSVRGSK